jgi:glycosyltransferase involved in cell wall biosynthesis
MLEPTYPRIICLSNVFDQHYHDMRGEKIDRALGSKRPVLFHCLEAATGRKLILLSSPPKAAERRKARWLKAVETRYSTHRQLFCANWDVPKLRIPLSWFFYARHVLKNVRSGDMVVIDNYEFIYILAARLARIFRKVTFILDYEDGKHLIDRGWEGVLSRTAERLGRPLIRAAMLAHPALGKRLPSSVPNEVIPGFIPRKLQGITREPGDEIRFLYSGALDNTRGVDLLLETLEHLPERGWHLDITGHGLLTGHVTSFAQQPRWKDKITYHHSLPPEAYDTILKEAHVGLNCQRASDPVSNVTFPSKVFTYLSTGLLVISSKAGAVEEICGNACYYYGEETAQSLANAMKAVISDFSGIRQKLDLTAVSDRYSIEASTARLRRMLQAGKLIE